MGEPKSGLYWLCHHLGPIIEWVWDEDGRRRFIDKNKPENERAIRQLCFQLVKGELPVAIAETGKMYVEACNAWKMYVEACNVYDKVAVACAEADGAFIAAVHSHKSELEAQYAQEYPESAKYWNGKEIVFPAE